MAKMRPSSASSLRRFDDDELDVRQFVGHGGFGPEFRETIDRNDVAFPSNAHAEQEYEDMRRLPDQTTYVDQFDDEGRYVKMQRVLSDPPMSTRVKNQVFNSIGARTGTMTSSSILDRSRGVGEMGEDGGIRSRAEVRPSDLMNQASRNPSPASPANQLSPRKGRY